jgi:hypothetical protein
MRRDRGLAVEKRVVLGQRVSRLDNGDKQAR